MSIARSIAELLNEAEQAVAEGRAYGAKTWATGFSPLDVQLGGGLRAGELILVGGAQGLGKTTFALQIARNVAASGHHALYLCYEHREQELLERLLAMELGLHGGDEAMTLTGLRRLSASRSGSSLRERFGATDGASAALATIEQYGGRLRLATLSGSGTGLDAVRSAVSSTLEQPGVVVVDYLQKVRVKGDLTNEDERVTLIAEGLKDLALESDLPLVAIAAADKLGVSGGRTQLHHLRGSTALSYEADVALLLNDKINVVAKHHLLYGTANAEMFRRWLVCSIEKNRSGGSSVDLEFEKHLDHGHFDPAGRHVAEQLTSDRLHE